MKRIGIVTSFNELNYGATLQAYALEKYLKELGWESEIVWLKSATPGFHDIRLKKLVVMAIRMLRNPRIVRKNILKYNQSFQRTYGPDYIEKFQDFQKNLRTRLMSGSTLQKEAKSDTYFAFICGSDQIWNSYALYVDPMYYLRFAPENKRIAYAPSFGKADVPDYNKKKIGKYVAEIPSLSVREKQGAEIIKALTGRIAQVVLDPTLLIDMADWMVESRACQLRFNSQFLFAYFLDEPSYTAREAIRRICELNHLKMLCITHKSVWVEAFDGAVIPEAVGPREFIFLIGNAKIVCTDSFHGCAFSINLRTPFLVFQREYHENEDQSTRITDMLDDFGMRDRYVTNTADDDLLQRALVLTEETQISETLDHRREEARAYLTRALERINI